MINKYFMGILLSLIAFPLLAQNKPVEQRAYANFNVIPSPQHVTKISDKYFVLDNNSEILYDSKDSLLRFDAQYLSDYIKEITGLNIAVKTKDKATKTINRCDEKTRMCRIIFPNKIVLSLDNKLTKPEGYDLTLSENTMEIKAKTSAGIFYGIQTIIKSLPIKSLENAKALEAVSFPLVKIEDYPSFAYRGFLLDVSRHFFPISYLKRFIDMLALHNINNFHWHLTDDQGWRIEIKKYPKLISIGSHRKQTIVARNSKEYDNTPVSGYYTQEQAKELVAYAAKRHINIIPEIDLPGHTMAVLAAYPELGCTGGPYEVPCKFGIFPDVLCAGNPKSLTFVKNVLSEIMDIFPSKYIHLGGDECPKVRWEKCTKCQALISKLHIKSTKEFSKEDQLQARFMEEIAAFLKSKGRKMMAWDEILKGNPDKDLTIMAWTSPKAAKIAPERSYKTIVCPITYLYLSNPKNNQLRSLNSVDRILNFKPINPELSAEQAKNVIGVEACLWTEWTKDKNKIEWQLLPRLDAVSELQWTGSKNINREEFYQALSHNLDLYKALKYNFKQDIYEAAIQAKPLENGDFEISLESLNNLPVYYTVDGSEPSLNSTLYKSKFIMKKGETLRCKVLRDNKLGWEATKKF